MNIHGVIPPRRNWSSHHPNNSTHSSTDNKYFLHPTPETTIEIHV